MNASYCDQENERANKLSNENVCGYDLVLFDLLAVWPVKSRQMS